MVTETNNSKAMLKFRLIAMNFLQYAVWGAYLTCMGKYLGRKVDERAAGTAAAICYAILNGCDVIRVHDVKFMKDIAVLSDMLRK